jgi:murein tripeptide amidase MpaA
LSIEGRKIESYIFGKGDNKIVFVGGIHGGYEWNSVYLAYEFIDYFTKNIEAIPENLTVEIVPSANPDGVFKIIKKDGRFELKDVPSGPKEEGRFNANGVDLNRNFDCNWQAESTWGQRVVSAGTEPFSEPESKVIQKMALEDNLAAFIFWHSQANAVYASQCLGESEILPETTDIMNAYADASGYQAYDSFDSYAITGDVGDWLSKIGIPAITVELKTHDTIEWEQNLAGVKSILEYYGNKE